MKNFLPLILATSALALAGCSTPGASKSSSHKSAIESVFGQRAKLEKEQVNFLNGERVAGLMAIDVHACPSDFRSAWFDYLVEIQTLHTRVERVVGVASAMGDPVCDLPSLIQFAAKSSELGQYLLTGLGKVDDAWAKVERVGMNYGVMPTIVLKR
jgi:hypothetical protein